MNINLSTYNSSPAQLPRSLAPGLRLGEFVIFEQMKRSQYRYVYLALALLGVAGGLLYWNFWGCTESCPIDSSWKISSLRGGLIGLCIAAFFHPSAKRPSESKRES